MAYGRFSRMDSRRQQQSCSQYFSTPTIVVLIALGLVGVWLLSSSSIVPAVVPPSDKISEATNQATSDKIMPSDDTSAPMEDPVMQSDNENNEQMQQDETTESSVNQNAEGETAMETVQKTEQPVKEAGENDEDREEKSGKMEESTKDTVDQPDEGNEANTDKKQEAALEQSGQDESSDVDSGSEEKNPGQVEEKVDQDSQGKDLLPDGAPSEIFHEIATQNGSFSTQAAESKKEKKAQSASLPGSESTYSWKLCNVQAGPDYIPCLDNEEAIKKLPSTKHYEHRERHCPESAPTCLVELPDGYKQPIEWPKSREKIWYSNVPHSKLAEVKGHQNWVKVSGEYLTFPGGGTQFKHGALHYIDFIKQSMSNIGWGRRSRVVLDVGCGVASFGGFLFDRDVLTMSFAPKDEHEAQVQFALERGIPAISAVMGTQRLPFPSNVFDVIHCARCRVPWHIEGGMLLLELNRLLRPGGYFVWSATPVYQKLPEDVEIWNAMSALTNNMCWSRVNKTKDNVNQVGLAIFRKPRDNKCYEQRAKNNPPLCQATDDANAAWNVPLQACMHKLPVDPAARGSSWPEEWPQRAYNVPYWMSRSQTGVYGKPANEDFQADNEHWRQVVTKSYASGMGINWSQVRNVMDMNAVYGGFAAALQKMPVWVMNIVPIDSPDTLPIIYERGFFGMYHDWCESFSTYPRSYDLIHADHLFSRIQKRCKLLPVITEVDRILRPDGKLIVRDDAETVSMVETAAKSLHWEVRMTYSEGNQTLLCVQKTMWRPTDAEAAASSA